MYTTDIRLEEVTVEEFAEMERFWNKHIIKRDNFIYARIHNPIKDKNYEKLLERLLESQLHIVFSVNDRGRWTNTVGDGITKSKIRTLAGIAEHDSRKRNYLEVKMRSFPKAYSPQSIIEFVEYQREIVGHYMAVTHYQRDYFTIQDSGKDWLSMLGLWVP